MRVAGLLVLCLTLASGYGAAVLKSGVHRDLCAWGAQYWCSSTKTADRCGKTSVCATRVWPQPIIKDTQCQVTQHLIKNSRQILDSRAYKVKSDHDIAMLLAKSCAQFEDETHRLQCKAVVTDAEILPKLMKLVATQLPTESTALAVGGCRRQEAKKSCQSCEAVTKSFQQYVSKAMSKDLYLRMFKHACDKFGNGKNICMAMAEVKYTAFRNGLVSANPSQVCSGKSLCLKKTLFQNSEKFDTCTTCLGVVELLRDVDRNQEVQGVIHNLLKSACVKLGTFKEVCDTLADEGLTYVFEIIATELEPLVLCETIHLCNGQAVNHILVPEMANKLEDSVECSLCQKLMSELEKIVTSKGTPEIKKVLEEFCGTQPSSLAKECDAFIDEFGPVIIRLIVSRLPPRRICDFIHMCQKKMGDTVPKVVPKIVSLKARPSCALCEFVMRGLHSMLDSNATETEIEQALEKVCQQLPSSISSECEQLVKTYGPNIISFLVDKLDPKMVCTALHLCQNTSVSMTRPKVSGDNCLFCELIMNQLDSILKENSTQAEIEAALSQVCNILPSSSQQECHDLVKTYAPAILKTVLQKLDPQKVCSTLGFCNSTSSRLAVLSKPRLGKQKTEICAICITVMQYAEKFIAKNSTENEIEALLTKVCNILPMTEKDICLQALPMFVTYIVQMFEQQIPPEEMCKIIKLCSKDMIQGGRVLAKAYSSMRVSQGEFCLICTLVAQGIDSLLEENATKQEVVAILDKVCSILPKEVKEQCVPFVTEYGPYVVDLLVQELNPQEICKRIGLCTNDSTVSKNLKSHGTVESNSLCEFCHTVFTELDNILKDNATEEEIKAALEKVCDLVPQSIKQDCTLLIDTYLPQILELLQKEINPNQICVNIGLCSSVGVKVAMPLKSKTRAGELCQICELVMGYLDDILKDNATQQEIEKALEQVCSFLPSSVKQECDSLIQTYFPVLIQLLVDNSPKELCTLLNLCTSKVKVAMPLKSKTRAGELCQICELVMGYLDDILKDNATQQEIEKAVEQVCGFLPSSLKQECDSLIQTYFPVLIQLLVDNSPKELCTLLNLCTSKVKVAMPLKSKTRAGELCQICELVMGYLDDILKDNATQQEIEKAVEQVCGFLPSSLKQECDSLIQTYFPVLIQLLVDNSPKELCTLLNLCTSKVKVAMPLKSKTRAGELCQICELVMGYLDDILKDNATQQEIEKAVEQVCGFLPSSLKQECDSLIQTYFPVLIQLLVDNSPKELCTLLNLCTSKVKVAMPLKSKTRAGELCQICELVMGYLDDILKDNATQQEIEKALEQVCGFLPSSLKQECDSLIQTYFPVLIQLLVDNSPKELCTLLNLCTSKVKTSMLLQSKARAGELCQLCEFVIGYLDGILKENATQQEIEQALEQVCKFLPASLKQECDSLIKMYFPQLVELLLKESPEQVCTLLGLCTSKVKTSMLLQSKARAGELCQLCEFVIGYLDGILKENATQQEIEQALEQVCKFLPASLKQECDSLIKMYFPQLVELLLKESPEKVCTLLGLCTSKVKTSMLLQSKARAGELCQLCEFVIGYLDGILKENATQQEIEQALEQVCKFLPASLKQECDSLIKMYFPQLVELLLKESPEQVCTLLGLCTSKVKLTQLKKATKVVSGQFCDICQFVMNYLAQDLKDNMTQQEILADLEEACSFLPSALKTDCDSLVKQYFPLIVDLLEQIPAAEICETLNLCPSQAKAQVKVEGTPCIVCEFVLKEIDNVITSNSTVAEIEKVLEKICSILPSTIRQDCDEFIKQSAPSILNLFVHGVSPKEVCSLLGLCSQQTTLTKSLVKVRGTSCILCEFVMKEIESMVTSNSTAAKIEKALDEVCNVLPSTIKKECDDLIKKYAPSILNFLIHDVTPQEVCTMLGLCSKHTRLTKSRVKVTGTACIMCELVIKELESMITSDSTVEDIEKALEEVCNVLPSTVRKECDDLIKQYAPSILNFLTHDVTPQEVCSMLGLCSQSTSFTKPRVRGATCILCEFVMKEIESMVASNSTAEEIEKALEEVCSILPSSIKKECYDFIQKYADEILKLLVNDVTPKEVCTALGLCSQQTRFPKSQTKVRGTNCILCELVMKEIESMVASNSTAEEVEKALEEVCSILPSSIKKDCDDFIQKYAAEILKLLVNDVTPKEVCTVLGLCSQQTKLATKPKTKVDGVLCVLCEFVLTQLENIISSNATEKEIEQALEKVCTYLPASIRQDCDDFIEKYGPEILTKLVQKLPPAQVCTDIKLCSGAKSPNQQRLTLTAKLQTGPKSTEFCDVCETAMKLLENLISSQSSQQEIETALGKVCSLLPQSVQEQCENFVKIYTPYVVDLLVQELPPKSVCEFLKLCQNSSAQDYPMVRKTVSIPKAGPLCAICEYVIKTLDALLEQNTTVAKIEAALDKVCSLLPSTVTDDCVQFVDLYAPELVDLVVEGLRPEKICTAAHLCNHSTIHQANPLPQVEPVQISGVSCVMCELVVSKIKTLIETNATEAEIEGALEKVCGLVPSSIKAECDELIQQYTQKIIKAILDHVPSKEICTKIGLCTGKGGLTLKSVEGCTMCKFVLEELKGFIQSPGSEVEIMKGMDYICARVPNNLQTYCKDLVTMFGPNLIEYLDNKIDPKSICHLVELCRAPEMHLQQHQQPQQQQHSNALMFVSENQPSTTSVPFSKANCTACKFAWYEIQTALATNFWETETKDILLDLCKHVKTWPDVCEYLVKQNLPALIEEIRGFRFPIQFCQELNMCPPQSQTELLKVSMGTTECEMCKLLAEVVDSFLKKGSTVNEAEALLTRFCNSVLPEDDKPKCISMVKEYTPFLIQLVAQLMDPQQVCQTIKLCSNNIHREAYNVFKLH